MKAKLAGIYAIRNLVNSDLYIGSSQNIRERWYEHQRLLEAGKHHSRYLQSAWKKYGATAFEFIMVEAIDDLDQLITVEQEYLDAIHPAYNMSPTAGSTRGWHHTLESRAKITAAQTGKKKPWLSHLLKGQPSRSKGHVPSEATRAKLSAAGKDRPKSEEHKAKIGAAHKGLPKPANIARNQSPEMRAAASRGNKGKAKPHVTEMNRNPEIRAKMAATRTGKHYPKMAEAIKAWHAKRKLEKAIKDAVQPSLWDEETA